MLRVQRLSYGCVYEREREREHYYCLSQICPGQLDVTNNHPVTEQCAKRRSVSLCLHIWTLLLEK